jgi:hypothetical protein
MAEFCNTYKQYIDFNDPRLTLLVDNLKNRDDSGELLNYSVELILTDSSLGRKLYLQVLRYGSPGDNFLLESIHRLTGREDIF